MRLFRKGQPADELSSWLPTGDEAINFPNESDEIYIMRLGDKEAFEKYFEASGMGFHAKDKRSFHLAHPMIEHLDLSQFEEFRDDPVKSNFYRDSR